MFETHSQPTKGHLLTSLTEGFTGGKVKTTNRQETSIRSLVEIKHNLHTIHKFNAITNLAFPANTKSSTIL
jgi:hypothetical protein